MTASNTHPPGGWENPGSWPAKIAFYLKYSGERWRRRLYAAVQDRRFRGMQRFTVLWEEPPVVLAAHTGVERLAPLPRGSLLLVAAFNSHEDASVRAATVASLRRHFPPSSGVRTVVLGNTQREADLLKADGVEAAFVNHNIFVDEEAFHIAPAAVRRYDAVYDAQLLPYKRHWLASKVGNLALVSYLYRPSPDMAYIRGLRRTLAGARWLNDPTSPDYRFLSLGELCEAYNTSLTGLCLSEMEGAMFASMQYLLCGLPVVNTPNLGGRDVFFEPDYALTVAPDPDAVAAGVREMIARRIEPGEIRSRALAIAEPMKTRFMEMVQAHIGRAGTQADFPRHFRSIFFHTMLKNRSVAAEAPGR